MNVKVIMNTTAHHRPAAKARLAIASALSEWRLRAERAKTSRPSFTLVELLVTVAVIGIMAGMILFALSGVRRDSLNAKTRSTIKKINEIILHRWEEFRYRGAKINVPDAFLQRIPQVTGNPLSGQVPISPREGARARMMILRDTMRMELPDRYADIWYPPSIYKIAAFSGDNGPPNNNIVPDSLVVTPSNGFIPRQVPGSYNSFREKMGLPPLGNPYVTPNVTPVPAPYPPITTMVQYENAEWLYQIVASSSYNGSTGLEMFHPSEIGDVDSDGMPEFIDAWGQPIMWLRWPAGYGVVDASSVPAAQRAQYIQERRPPDSILNDTSTPDPLDSLHTDWRWTNSRFNNVQKPWMLVPLIVSAGADGMFDLQFDTSPSTIYAVQTWTFGTDSTAHTSGGPYYFVDPYVGFYDTSQNPAVAGAGGLGQFIDEDSSTSTIGTTDNITNYEIILE
ncbi:MAG: type II secretion system protein [Pirellulales bacterium]